MKKHFVKKALSLLLSLTLAVGSTVFPTCAFASQSSAQTTSSVTIPDDAEYVKGEAIAVLKDGLSSKKINNVKSTFGSGMKLKDTYDFSQSASSVSEFDGMKIATFKSNTLTTEQIIAKLNKSENVEYAFANYKLHIDSVTDDEYSQYQWALENNSQNGGTEGVDINADSLWSRVDSSSEEKVVAVVDTGIDYNSEELKDSLWVNTYGSKLVGKYGYDFTDENEDNSPLDTNGHGTHVSGIIAAKSDNKTGISGVNKTGVKIMSLKVGDSEGNLETDDAIAAYEYIYRAIKLGVNVVAVNNSWGGYGSITEKKMFDELFDKVGKLGAVSFIAAGNEGSDLGETVTSFLYDEPMYYIPAASDSDYAVTVAATNENDSLASFSNYSKKYTDIAAPGTDILSTVSYNCFNPTIYTQSQIDEICSFYQDYDDEPTSDEFGSYSFTAYDESLKPVETQSALSLSSAYFGTGGKSLNFKINDSQKDGDFYYAIAIPFTLEDENKNYTMSMMINGNEKYSIDVFDISKSQFDNFDYDKITEESFAYSVESYGSDYWDHLTIPVDVDEFVENNSYVKSKDRILLMLVSGTQGGEFNIDDLAVSKQEIDESEFGKYDFYNGTSMACPYALGAYALVLGAYPEASPLEAVNVVKSTGRISSVIGDKTENSRSLSLDNTQAAPPLITSVSYNSDGNVSLKGAFGDVIGVSVNSQSVTPVSTSKYEIVIKDNGYNTKKNTVSVENVYGTSQKEFVIVKNKALADADIENPEFTDNVNVLTNGNTLYFVDYDGGISTVVYDSDESAPICTSYEYQIDLPSLGSEGDNNSVEIESAAYYNGEIYFIANVSCKTSTDVVIGNEYLFGKYNLNTSETKRLCELVNDSVQGASLAAYNGKIYLIGGYDVTNSKYLDTVYAYNSSSNKFVLQSAKLPQATAFAKAVQYKDKLVVSYGANDLSSMPGIYVFNGSSWSTAFAEFTSDYPISYTFSDGKKAKVYKGALSIGENGVLFTGTFAYGYGDIFTYNTDNGTITTGKYTVNGSADGSLALGGTVNGCMVAFNVKNDDDLDYTAGAFYTNMKTSFASVTVADSNYGYGYAEESSVMYGNYVNVYADAAKGYAVTNVTANGAKCNFKGVKSISAKLFINKNTTVKISYKKIVPNKVTNLKVSKKTSNSVTLSWKKPSRAQGYKIQEYKNKKWVTIATVRNGDTLKYKIKKVKKGTHKYRVYAYAKYNNTLFKGAASSAVKVKVK